MSAKPYAPEAVGRNGVQLVRKSRLQLEASSACQLRCPSCPTTTGHTEKVVGKNTLRLADFVRLVDDNPWIARIELSNYGEVFLNPDLLGIFAHAERRNVRLSIANGANLNHVRDDVLEGLVRHQIEKITCSIDGASQETYGRYRVRGNFERVIANVRRINEFKQIYKRTKPVLVWQFIAFGHNEHEITAAKQMAEELSMTFRVKLNWDPNFSPVQDQDLVREVSGTGAASRTEYLEKTGRDYKADICHQLWDSPQINWDGKVLGCCRNFWGEFGGNVFRDGLRAGLDGEKIAYARAMLKGGAPEREDIPCTTCDIYLERKTRANWVDREDPLAPEDLDRTVSELWCKAVAHTREGKDARALETARLVLQLRPAHPRALDWLGQAARLRGREEAAEYYFAKSKAARVRGEATETARPLP